MTPMPTTCREIEPDLVAVAAGEAERAAVAAVETHVDGCASCRRTLEQYRAVEEMVSALRRAPQPEEDTTLARAQLESRLADLRSRAVSFGLFESPLGPILIARSELGVSMVEYLDSAGSAASRLSRLAGDEARESAVETESVYRELLEYLEGRRVRLDWPLDLRWVRSDFQRRVLEATSRLPYGAVASYGHIAREIGAPTASRAVAQALRWNPVPIAIPCHRVIGGSGDLTGYAGDKIALKERLLGLEGVPVLTHGVRSVARRAMYVSYQALTEYCLPTCGALPETPLAQLTLFGSRERAEGAGLTPCGDCRPDLHPISA